MPALVWRDLSSNEGGLRFFRPLAGELYEPRSVQSDKRQRKVESVCVILRNKKSEPRIKTVRARTYDNQTQSLIKGSVSCRSNTGENTLSFNLCAFPLRAFF